jgi:hypothetical protein
MPQEAIYLLVDVSKLSTEELHMNRIKIVGLAIGTSLLFFGYQPITQATPMAAPLSTVESSNSNVVQARVHHGVAVRSTRRHVRRAVRRGY